MPTNSTGTHGTEDWAWDVARLFPAQGEWTESDYLNLTDETNCLVEFTDGRIEVLEMPTTSHQQIVLFLLEALRAFVKPSQLGQVLMAPLRVRIREGKFREPDIVFMSAENRNRVHDEYWEGADLVMEVVSAGKKSRDRDLRLKRDDYAEAGIREYWIVDPQKRTATVLQLENSTFVVRGESTAGEQASSGLLDGFTIDVDSIFAAV